MDQPEPAVAPIERRILRVTASDGASARVQLHLPAQPRAALYWMPALGVGLRPNETFADAMASSGIAVAVHEWRGLGESDRRASHRCNWGYRELFEYDIPAGLAAARASVPRLRWHVGGHSLGGQLALIQAARTPAECQGVLLVASGQPYWRSYGVSSLALAAAIPIVTAVVGYFPGSRLRFAGREAKTLMRDWARTLVRGDYRLPAFGDSLNQALDAYAGSILAVRMSQDWLAPPASVERLRLLTPRAQWRVLDFGTDRVQRPDHFGWLREPAAVVSEFMAWQSRG